LAEYRNRHEDFRQLGVEVAALSADSPEASERLRGQLRLPFPLLCDPERQVITSWGLLNPKQHGGIAYPAVFVLDPGLSVRYRSLDGTAARIHSGSLLEFLRTSNSDRPARPPRRVPIITGLADWREGIRNYRDFTRSR
jgi:peroxiredoxin Q/BCP